ncbi:MAG: energy coupling factor transporter S component ThiW [Firmicutes bacterium]|nr:energy coupling factor transporter S component ThiW [Bacillota bacterium]
MNSKTKKLVLTAIWAAMGFVLTPILRIPGYAAPMQHLINVSGVVIMGPLYGFACSALLTVMKIIIMGEDLFSIPGGLIGAFLAAVMFAKTNNVTAAVVGEVFGTGILGALCSYPLAKFYYGTPKVAVFTYIPAFMISTCFGSLCAVVLIHAMKKSGLLYKLQREEE